MKQKLSSPKISFLLIVGLFITALVCSYFSTFENNNFTDILTALQKIFDDQANAPEKDFFPQNDLLENTLRLHIIDVDQALCILVQGPEKTILIDGGEGYTAPSTITYLQQQGVKHLDRVINTHPHYDHFGGLQEIMQTIPTKEFMWPKLPQSLIPTTVAYHKLIDYLEESKIPVLPAQVGDVYSLGQEAVMTTLGPIRKYNNLNDSSVVLRITWGKVSFLITGDIEVAAERDLVKQDVPLECNVLILPHHGSKTSILPEFVQKTNPQYGIISCGKNNDYGHPHPETITIYNNQSTTLLRTDELGTIVFDTNGENLTYDTYQQNAA